MSSVAALLSYYSRRPWAMVLTGNLVSLLSVTSITLGGLLTGKHGNCYAVAGAGLLLLSSYLTRTKTLSACRATDLTNYTMTLANLCFVKGMITDSWDLPHFK